LNGCESTKKTLLTVVFFIITRINIAYSELPISVGNISHTIEEPFIANAGVTIMLVIKVTKTAIMATKYSDLWVGCIIIIIIDSYDAAL
jgi:hypothetical protein